MSALLSASERNMRSLDDGVEGPVRALSGTWIGESEPRLWVCNGKWLGVSTSFHTKYFRKRDS